MGQYSKEHLIEKKLTPNQLAIWVLTGTPYFRGELPSEIIAVKNRIVRAISAAIAEKEDINLDTIEQFTDRLRDVFPGFGIAVRHKEKIVEIIKRDRQTGIEVWSITFSSIGSFNSESNMDRGIQKIKVYIEQQIKCPSLGKEYTMVPGSKQLVDKIDNIIKDNKEDNNEP